MKKLTTCLNCETMVEGAFCSTCGQETKLDRITFVSIWQDFLNSAFSLNTPLLYSMRKLFTNPGEVFREYTAGKRQTYYPPVSLFILCTAIYLLIRALADFDPLAGRFPETESLTRYAEAARFMVKNINYIMIFLVGSLGLMLKLFFWRSYNLAEYIMMGFYVASLYIMIAIIVMLLRIGRVDIPSSFQVFVLLGIVLYTTLSLFKGGGWFTYLRTLFVAFFSILLYITLSFGFSIIIILLR